MNELVRKPLLRLFPGIWIAASVFAALVLCIGVRWLRRPHDLEKLAENYASVYLFQKPPVINHAGTMIGSIHTTPRGVGVFIADVRAKTEKNICEVRSMDFMNDLSHYNMDAQGVFGWSPDDGTFAFLWDYKLYFLPNGGEKISGGTDSHGIRSFAWLSSDSCAYIDDGQKLVLLKDIDGKWSEQSSWTLSKTNGAPRALMVIDPVTVAWITDNALWKMDISSGEVQSVYSDSQKQMASASWCQETESFLLTANVRTRNGRNQTSAVVLLRSGQAPSVVKSISGSDLITEAQWVNGGKGWAYTTTHGEKAFLTVRPDDSETEQQYFTSGKVEKIVCNTEDSCVYAFAVKTNEPPGFWRCDFQRAKAAYVLPPWGYRDLLLNFQPALTDYAPWGDRHKQQITLFQPAHFSRHKQYPLLIALDGYTWIDTGTGTYAQTLANAGAYVAISNYHYNRRRYNLENIDDYTNIVLGIYQHLVASPNIDAKRVYLFGPSFVTHVMSDVVKEFPGRWKGIMLCGPSALPEPRLGMTGRIIATTGEGEHETRFPQYQTQLLELGIPMEWRRYPDDAHIERAQNTMREQALLMARMVFDE